jgi:hypothetical protein
VLYGKLVSGCVAVSRKGSNDRAAAEPHCDGDMCAVWQAGEWSGCSSTRQVQQNWQQQQLQNYQWRSSCMASCRESPRC